MKYLQSMPDKAAISLSLLCMLHCLAAPTIVVLLPSLAALSLEDEALHYWILIAVVPISIYALTMGCKQHKRYQVLLMGSLGLSIIIAAPLLGHDFLGEMWEKILTVVGSCVIAFGHFRNYRLCNDQVQC